MKKSKPPQNATGIRLPADIREYADRRCAEEGRSLNNWIQRLILDDQARQATAPPRTDDGQ